VGDLKRVRTYNIPPFPLTTQLSPYTDAHQGSTSRNTVPLASFVSLSSHLQRITRIMHKCIPTSTPRTRTHLPENMAASMEPSAANRVALCREQKRGAVPSVACLYTGATYRPGARALGRCTMMGERVCHLWVEKSCPPQLSRTMSSSDTTACIIRIGPIREGEEGKSESSVITRGTPTSFVIIRPPTRPIHQAPPIASRPMTSIHTYTPPSPSGRPPSLPQAPPSHDPPPLRPHLREDRAI
jgi:hypothetical protein